MIGKVRKAKRDRGVALIEFALASFTTLLLLFGIIDAGRAAYAYNWVSSSARLGSRYMMVRGDSCSALQNYPIASGGPDNGCPAYNTDVSTYVATLATGIDPSQLTVSSFCYSTGANAPSSPPCAVGSYIQVKVKYNFKFLSPLSPESWSMTSTSERVVEN